MLLPVSERRKKEGKEEEEEREGGLSSPTLSLKARIRSNCAGVVVVVVTVVL